MNVFMCSKQKRDFFIIIKSKTVKSRQLTNNEKIEFNKGSGSL